MVTSEIEVSRNEKIVLFTSRIVPSSMQRSGDKRYRLDRARQETGISEEEWIESIQSCIEKGLLTKGRKINKNGLKVIENIKVYRDIK